MSGAPKILVAGGGVLGLTCALRLAQAGAAVTLSDPAAPLANASGVAAGMLAPAFEAVLDDAARPHLDLLSAARDLWPELAADIGLALDRRGALAVGETDWLARLEGEFSALGLPYESIPAQRAATLAPGAAAGAGLFTPEDWRLDAASGIDALRRAGREAGVEFRTAHVRGRGGHDLVVAATGWDATLAPELSAMTPIKGHILRLPREDYGGVVVRGRGVYAAPGQEGAIVGATMEPGVSGPAVDPEQVVRLMEMASKLVPGWDRTDPRASTGVRAATTDGLPLVGWSRAPGVILAAGARRNGWLLAPLVAKRVVDLVFDRAPDAFAARLDPARFG